jgi:hypothetical protein
VIDILTSTQVFALIGLVLLVGVLVMGEMFERAIQRDYEEHDSHDEARTRAERAADDRE